METNCINNFRPLISKFGVLGKLNLYPYPTKKVVPHALFIYHFVFRLLTLSEMRAHDELSEEQVRQMLFDIEQSYNAFNCLLQHT